MADRTPSRFAPRVTPLDDRITPSLVTSLASLKADGTQGAGNSQNSALSADGRFVAFLSAAQLTADDTNAFQDVYLKDRMTGGISLVSRADGMGGAAGNGGVLLAPSVSADGRYVVFDSLASNLVAGDANANYDVFLRDTLTGTTTLVSRTSGAAAAQGDDASVLAHISADGRFVSFASLATNLVAGDANGAYDVFVRDLVTSATTAVSTDSSGNFGNAASTYSNISADGRYVVYGSDASNLVGGDTNGVRDVFVKDRQTGVTARVSVATDGTQGNSSSATGTQMGISGDGRFVTFESDASSLVAGDTNLTGDVFLRDRTLNTTVRVSVDAGGAQANGLSRNAQVSGNGRYVVFESAASNLVTGDSNGFVDVFVKDRVTGAIVRASVAADGTQANGVSGNASISRTGEFVSFDSGASNLAADANGFFDVFVNQRPLPALLAAAPSAGGSSQVQVFNPDGSVKFSFFAYDPAYTGGVFVALGDVTGDGIDDVVTSTGVGGDANIRVFEGVSGGLVMSFYGYPPGFTGGVNVAVADVNNDGYGDIVCGVGRGGGPNVRVFSGQNGTLLSSFFSYDAGFTGGVRVASADINGDGYADIVTGVGSGGGPNVRVFDGRTGGILQSFYAYPAAFTGGLFLSMGDVNNDGLADLVTGVESGGGPNVRAYDLTTQAVLRSFYAFDSTLTGGVRVSATDLNGDGFDDFIAGTGSGTPGLLRTFSGKDTGVQLLPERSPFGGFLGGVNVG